MTDDERAAREWAERVIAAPYPYHMDNMPAARTILRLLDRPVLPRGSDVPDDVMAKMFDAYFAANCGWAGMRAAIDILRAHLTAPPPKKKVEAWAVVWPDGHRTAFTYQEDAEDCGRRSPVSVRIVRLVEADDADK